jgi:FAD synthase
LCIHAAEEFDSQPNGSFYGFAGADVYAVSSSSSFLENKRSICTKFGIGFRIVHQHNPYISSSLLMANLLNRHIAGPQIRYRTIVVPGHGRGKGMGIPTLNLKAPIRFPYQHGIYAGYVWLKGARYQGAFHYGPVPTFNQSEVSLEVFLLHRRRDIAQRSITFQLVQYLRPIMQFSSKHLLLDQIRRDVALATIVI